MVISAYVVMSRFDSVFFFLFGFGSISHVTKKTDMPHGNKRFDFFVTLILPSFPCHPFFPFFLRLARLHHVFKPWEDWLVLFYLQS
jgi:4-amino-4-deoxy-L-arabinose transferase-like glycosyltransferase